jgi:crossover junction endodeoxyribonuclease RusA
MLRWTDEQHAAWKARQAREYAQQESTSVSVDGHAAGQHGGGSAPAARSGASTTRNLGNPTAPAGHGAGVEPGTLTLPWPPTGNTSVRHGNGGHYLTQDVRDYRQAVAAICRDYAPVKGRYRLHVHLSPPDKRRRDADNAIKNAVDALVHAGYIQDDAMAYMRELVVTVSDDPCYGWAKVRAVPMEEA